MMNGWTPKETNTHQDHVIAHVRGATVLGYFIIDESLHLLLDMGFIWTIHSDGEMALLPQGVMIGELDIDDKTRQQLLGETDLLLQQGYEAEGLVRLTRAPVDCLIKEVDFFTDGDQRRLLLTGEEASLVVDTSLATAEIEVHAL